MQTLFDVEEQPMARKITRFIKPTVEQVAAYCAERQNGINAEQFCDFYESKGWVVGRSPMKDWKAAVRTWERSRHDPPAGRRGPFGTLSQTAQRWIDDGSFDREHGT